LPQELIILIHGTGTGTPIEVGSQRHWWQLDSTFAKGLTEDLERSDPGRFKIGDEFTWGDGGANSELIRRTAGVELERVLRGFDAKGQQYHIVGHSHGGSVIWHALVHSVAFGRKPLTDLASWTTVGTPYLEFRPDPFSIWPAVPFVALVVAALALWLQNPDVLSNVDAAWRFANSRAAFIPLIVVVLALLAERSYPSSRCWGSSSPRYAILLSATRR
jgi:hypothetical protein